jgi:hypothetical protein
MKTLFDESPELGGADPIDAAVPAPKRRLPSFSRVLRTRAATGLAPAVAPALIFVPLGVLLGPYGLGVLSPEVMVHLDAVVSVALGALGVFVGMALTLRVQRDRALFVAGSIEALTTIVVVTSALWYLVEAWRLPLTLPPVLVALTLAVSAAASSAGAVEETHGLAHRTAARIADLDDALPIVVGGAVLVLLASTETRHAGDIVGWTLATAAVGLVVALAGWLLFEHAHDDAERLSFVVGVIVLLGGATAYLAVSPLLAGLVAGLFWTWAPGRAEQIVRSHIRRFQHPLIVVLLFVAGASCRWSQAALWLFLPLVLFRLTAKLTGGWLATRVRREIAPADLGAYLVAPGLIGIAYILNVHQVVGENTGAVLLTATTAAVLASELIAPFVAPGGEADER